LALRCCEKIVVAELPRVIDGPRRFNAAGYRDDPCIKNVPNLVSEVIDAPTSTSNWHGSDSGGGSADAMAVG
jgi:hypothetical protein